MAVVTSLDILFEKDPVTGRFTAYAPWLEEPITGDTWEELWERAIAAKAGG